MYKLERILIEDILELKYDIDSKKIKGIYLWGSFLYGTNTDSSDYDFVVIVDMIKNDHLHYKSENVDIHYISEKHYKELLDKHDIMALECFYQTNPIMKYDVEFVLDKVKLRHSISSVVSNSWVKAKKKVILEYEDNLIGYKSLFHSFRIVIFAIQMLKYGEIEYNSANKFLDIIQTKIQLKADIEDILKDMKPEHNKLLSEFRILAPKE